MPTHLEIAARLKQQSTLLALGKASTAELGEYAAALCSPNAYGEFNVHQFPQICETVRIHLLRAHIEELQKHITALDAKNTTLQKLVAALAAIAIVVGVAQITVAILAYIESRPTKTPVQTLQSPSTQSGFPTLPATPSSGQPTKK